MLKDLRVQTDPVAHPGTVRLDASDPRNAAALQALGNDLVAAHRAEGDGVCRQLRANKGMLRPGPAPRDACGNYNFMPLSER